MTKTRTILYWSATIILALALLSGGLAQLAQRPETVEGFKHLGYPVYLGMILGFWKVLGAVAILIPGIPRIKEWAYAGIFFNMTGAFVSHSVIGDGGNHLIAPMFFVLLNLTSWALRPQSRIVGELFPRSTSTTVCTKTKEAAAS